MQIIKVPTPARRAVIDITERIKEIIKAHGMEEGLVNIFALHTTVGVTTADLDPGTDQDMLDAFEAIMPKLHYRHPHNPAHAGDHIMASLIGPNLMIPVVNFAPILGDWQSIVLVELNGPKDRNVAITLLGAKTHTENAVELE